MGGGDIRVVHAIPGRIRLKVSKLKNNPASAVEVEVRLRKLSGVKQVRANPVTGSITVTYLPTMSRSTEIAPELSRAFESTLFQGTDPDELLRQLIGNGNGSSSPRPLANRIQGFLGTIDHGVERVSRGAVDLRLLVPVALLCIGLGIIATSSAVPMPTWYDFVWAAFATFAALNLTDHERPLAVAPLEPA